VRAGGAIQGLLALPFRPGGARGWGLQLQEVMAPEAHLQVAGNPAQMVRLLAGQHDLVHTVLPFVRTSKPLLATVHGDFEAESPLYRRGYRSLLRRADAVTVPSTFLRDRLRERGLADLARGGIQVIPNGCADATHRWTPRVDAGAGGLRLLVASKFAFPDKTRGTVELVQNLAALRSALGPFTVDVVGGGALAGQVRDAVQAAGPGFQFLGWRDDLPRLMAQADLLVYRSYLDNQPLLLIQAMLCGLPILANRVGDTPNMLAPAALADGREELARALERLQAPEARLALSLDHRARAERTYLWAQVKPRWLTLYRELLAAHGPA